MTASAATPSAPLDCIFTITTVRRVRDAASLVQALAVNLQGQLTPDKDILPTS